MTALANVEWEMSLTTDPWLQLALLDWLSPHVNRWLDATRVHGDRAARRRWARICRCYLSVAYFVALRGLPNGALARIVDTCVRLNGLRLTPDPTR